ncbi:hypothetical protein JCM8097_002514 [Rhodosporidiobolus ruineniae]
MLPAELWDHCLALLSPQELQHTALALSRALPPPSHISLALLVRHLRITREGQALQTLKHLRSAEDGLEDAVRTVTAQVWREDPQLLVNLLLALPSVRSISLTIGPLAQPENLEDLLHPDSIARTGRWKRLEQLSFRFNPYVSERSYYTFLKGAYFDSAVHTLSRLDPSLLPSFTRLSFAQDLPPTHGVKRKETLAFGLHDLGDSIEQISLSQVVVPTSGRHKRKTALKTEKMDFAQPIVFFQLSCLTTLSQSPLGSQLTHLTFRLPRRALLPSLTDHARNPLLHPPFAALKHLDLSTTHIVDDARFPIFLRLHPGLESLVLDRCSGLISAEAVDEPTAVGTLRWLGKCCGGIGLSRAEDAVRSWRRIQKERPSDAPNVRSSSSRPSASSSLSSTPTPAPSYASGEGDLVPPVRELCVVPPPTALIALGFGLHDLSPRTAAAWERAFADGHRDATKRTVEKLEDCLERWERWSGQGKLADGTRRLVTFRDALAHLSPLPSSGGQEGEGGAEEEEYEDPDPTFARFCALRRLVPISPSQAKELLSVLLAQPAQFSFCPHPDCSNSPGTPHLSLGAATGGEKEDHDARRQVERDVWEREKREEEERRADGRHVEGCAHRRAREAWDLEQFA